MSRHFGLSIIVASSLLLSGCYVPGNYGYNGYNRSYGSTGTPPGNNAAASVPQAAAASPPPPSPAVPMPRPLLLGPSSAAAAPGGPPDAAHAPPAGGLAANTSTPIEPAAAEPSFSGAIALPALVLPVRQNWSSAKCSNLAVTFTGNAQPHEATLADTASFEEARQYRDGDYAEMAECFCAKSGSLSDVSKAAAGTVMNQMARQFAEQLYMQTRNISYVEQSPLGAYSQVEASSENPATLKATLRVYWHGQCSVRLATVWTPATAQRAAEFLNSLREIKGEKVLEADVPMAVPVVPVITAALPPPKKGGAVSSSTSLDLEQEMKQKGGAPADASAPSNPFVAATAPDQQVALAAPDPSANQGAATRLRQLQELKRKGLINESEYDTKRAAILNGL
jgi:hypothetical protein